MSTFSIDKTKAIESIKLVLLNIGGKSDFHKLFKILYFADQKHLVKYGDPIIGDTYIAMKNGPVPSQIYSSFNLLRSGIVNGFNENFEVQDYFIYLKNSKIDLDEFSESEIECLTESIEENRNFTFDQLTKKSHGLAYRKADLNDSISFFDIALEGGANQEMIKYINHQIEMQQITNGSSW
jgi:uncharacterized phage-associated protein